MELLDRLQTRFPEHYRHGNILMIHGDCMDVMAELGEKEMPLAIVDPPYGIKDKIISGGNSDSKIKLQKNLEKFDILPNKEYFDELFRVSKNQIIWGGNYFVDFLSHSRGGLFGIKEFLME